MADPVLPKGIVLNTSWIYDEIAKEPVVSPEAIKKYWRVYTTTFQRLFDPTANRLENFWWHVWGSDRRHLPGPVLAQLFKDISTGPTFVKLRGPPNRYEPPSEPSSPVLSPAKAPNAQPVPAAKQDAQQPKVEKKPVESSSSKKPPAKPILKKPRGPSSSGPRPTARFVSPPGTDAEDVDSRESEAASSTSTTVTSTGTAASKAASKASTKDAKKKTTAGGPKKKGPTIVASTSRRRPAMPRRQSSQSTTGGSETTSKEKGRGDSPALTPENEPKLSVRAGGKRPATQAIPEENSASKPSTKQSTASPTNANERPAAAQSEQVVNPRLRDAGDGPKNSAPVRKRDEVKVAEPALTRKSSDGREHTRTDSSTTSNPFSPRRGSGETKHNRRPIALTSSSTTITSNATAQGTIIEFDDSSPTRLFREETERLEQESGSSSGGNFGSSRHDASALFAPTPPSATPEVPLSRSKSQLALLLGRQGDKKHRR